MMIHIPERSDARTGRPLPRGDGGAAWVDGNVTPGHQSAKVKHNLQLPEDSPEARELGDMVIGALAQPAVHLRGAAEAGISAAVQPLRGRHDVRRPCRQRDPHPSAGAGAHAHRRVGDALHFGARRTTTAASLIVEDTYGSHAVKLPAGDMIVYPATSLHRVTPITRGSRIASFFWTQSMIRDEAQRAMLFDLDMAIMRLASDQPGHKSIVSLTAIYHNLLRQWAEL